MANVWFVASVLAFVGLLAAGLEILTGWWWPWGDLIPGIFLAPIVHLKFAVWLRPSEWAPLAGFIVWLPTSGVIYFRVVPLILQHSSS